jgi:dihydroneopterin aldolase
LCVPCQPALLREFPSVADVRVGVQKPHVAVTGVLGSLGVEIFRTR